MSAYAQTVKNYTINITNKTITFTDYSAIVLERIALITDVTTGNILFQFNSTAVTGSVSGNVLTLSTMAGLTSTAGATANTDKLRIDYTNATGDPTYETPALPNNAATAGKQDTGNASLATISSNTSNLATSSGQSSGNSSLSTIATNTTGVATSAKQDTGNASLSSIATNTSGSATSAKQDTGNASLSTIATNTGAGATAANQTNGNQIARLSDGTNQVNILKSDGTAAGQNAELMAGTYQSIPFLVSAAGNGTGIDVGNYQSFTLQIAAFATGTSLSINVQGSNDNTNWANLAPESVVSGNGPFSGGLGTGVYFGALPTRWIRLVYNGTYTSGNTTGTLLVSTLPVQLTALNVLQNGTWTVTPNGTIGSGVPTSAFLAAGTDGGNLRAFSVGRGPGNASDGSSTQSVQPYRYNGTNYDLEYNNVNGIAKAAGQTATTTTSITNYNGKNLVVLLNIASGTGTVQITIQGTTSGGYTYPLLIATATSTIGVSVYRVGVGLTASSGLVANDVVPRTFQIVATVSGTVAYGVDYIIGV